MRNLVKLLPESEGVPKHSPRCSARPYICFPNPAMGDFCPRQQFCRPHVTVLYVFLWCFWCPRCLESLKPIAWLGELLGAEGMVIVLVMAPMFSRPFMRERLRAFLAWGVLQRPKLHVETLWTRITDSLCRAEVGAAGGRQPLYQTEEVVWRHQCLHKHVELRRGSSVVNVPDSDWWHLGLGLGLCTSIS